MGLSMYQATSIHTEVTKVYQSHVNPLDTGVTPVHCDRRKLPWTRYASVQLSALKKSILTGMMFLHLCGKHATQSSRIITMNTEN